MEIAERIRTQKIAVENMATELAAYNLLLQDICISLTADPEESVNMFRSGFENIMRHRSGDVEHLKTLLLEKYGLLSPSPKKPLVNTPVVKAP